MLRFIYEVDDIEDAINEPTFKDRRSEVCIHEDSGVEGIFLALKDFLSSCGFHHDTVKQILNIEEDE